MGGKHLLRVFVCAIGVLAIVLGVTSCADPKAEANKNFVGTWELSGMSMPDANYSEEDLGTLKQVGVGCYLTIQEGGTATLQLFGAESPAKWTAKDATTAELKLEDGSQTSGQSVPPVQEMKVANGSLTMASDGSSLTFKKIDPSEKLSSQQTSSSSKDEQAKNESASKQESSKNAASASENSGS